MRHNFTDQQILEAIQKAGGKRAAARLLGVAWSTFRDRIKKCAFGTVCDAVVIPPATPFISEEERRTDFVSGAVPKGNKHRVLVVGDLHEPFTHNRYRQFVREVYDEFACDTVVFIGDVTDNHAMSYHEHNPNGLSAGEELEQARKRLKEWYKIFPNALVCIGNHDEILFRKAVTHGLPGEAFKNFGEIYKTPDGWKWRLSWEIDNVLYQHGTGSSGENAHKTRALKNRQSTVIGHVHSHAGVAYLASDKDLIFGMNVGCGIDIKSYAMMYGRNFASRPTLGCGVVLNGKHAFFVPMDLGTKIRWV